MPPSTRDPDDLRSQIRGGLTYAEVKDARWIDVLYTLNKQDLREHELANNQVELSPEEVNVDHEVSYYVIMRLSIDDDVMAILPRRLVGPDRFEKRYQRVEFIVLEGFGISDQTVKNDVVELLATLPKGFNQNPDYGLGLRKEYRHIVEAIEEIENVTMIVISKLEPTSLQEDRFYLSYSDFEAARRGINTCHRNALQEAATDKNNFVHNMFLTKLDAERYPPKARTPSEGVMAKLLELGIKNGLSEKNQLAAAKLVTSSNRSLVKRHPEVLMELSREIELVTLEEIITKITSLIEKNTKEGKWQNLFNDHPFILSLAFSLPLILFKQQVSVGGRSFSRKGENIADFLLKNSLTDNATIVEIKAASTPLLASVYRNIYPPSKELAGSITQALEQKHKLEENFLALRSNSEDRAVERYSTKCIVVAGKMPTNKVHLQSFELFRATLHDVVVVTFDELLSKLQHLYHVLSGKSKGASLDASSLVNSSLQPIPDEEIPF